VIHFSGLCATKVMVFSTPACLAIS